LIACRPCGLPAARPGDPPAPAARPGSAAAGATSSTRRARPPTRRGTKPTLATPAHTPRRPARLPRPAGNNASRPIGVKNLSQADIQEHVSWLRTTHGRTVQRRVTTKHIVSSRPSIQGPWNPSTASLMQQVRFEAQQQEGAAAGQ
jgi:hypothetical protein